MAVSFQVNFNKCQITGFPVIIYQMFNQKKYEKNLVSTGSKLFKNEIKVKIILNNKVQKCCNYKIFTSLNIPVSGS
jgi:hypothetical protein